ncbi:hypothetical protein [Flavobacterium sp.]|uniref:hypothetical protein n=1 Tax=Flavobacterium sp. TaxID=239 RepID=UPI00286E83EB|nr:hypothetical protein [Flavobacterium sp.]
MSEIREIVDSLENRFEKFLKKMEDLQEVNRILSIKLNESEKIVSNLNQEIKEVKSNFDAMKITNSLLGSDEYKRDTKLKINSLIREIDYCIAQLSD